MSVYPRWMHLRGFSRVAVENLPLFALICIVEFELLLTHNLRDDVALLAIRPLRSLTIIGEYWLLLAAVYVVPICGCFFYGWVRFIRSELGRAIIAAPGAEFPWPGTPRLPWEQGLGHLLLVGGLALQLIVGVAQALWAASALDHAARLPHGDVRSFWIGIAVFRVGVSLAALGAFTATPLVWPLRRDRVRLRRTLAALAVSLVLAGVVAATVGALKQIRHPVPKAVHRAVMHPYPPRPRPKWRE